MPLLLLPPPQERLQQIEPNVSRRKWIKVRSKWMRNMWPKHFAKGIRWCQASSVPLSCGGSVWRRCLSIAFDRNSRNSCKSIELSIRLFVFFFFFKWSIPIHRPAARRRCRRRWKRPWQETVTESEISMVGLAPSTVDNQRWRGRETLHVAFETESAPHSGHLLPGNVWFKSSKIFLNECQRSQPTVLCIRETHRTRIFISLTINWQTICYRAHTSIQHIFILFFLGSFNICCPSVEHPIFFFFIKSLVQRIGSGYFCLFITVKLWILNINCDHAP